MGVTGAKVMACLYELVSTEDLDGIDSTEHETTALLSPERNSRTLADSLRRLLADDELRREMAHARNQRIHESRGPCG